MSSEPDAQIEAQVNEILAVQERIANREEPAEPGPLEPFYRWMERKQVWLFIPLVVGLILWPIFGPRVGLTVSGSAVIGAGLIPLISGRYRSRAMRLNGMPARMRGLFSISLGVVVILAGWSL